jgi:outer membrane putative beta-barrel porin/alpha-amylase
MLLVRWLAAIALLVPSTLCALGGPARAQDEEPDLEFFYPVVTRRPVIERELEFRMQAEKSSGGTEYTFVGALEYPIFSWWQVELEIPIVSSRPKDESSQAGVGDITLENTFRVWKSVEQRALVAAGFELTLPSGSRSRGLGGDFAIEPFVTAAMGLGPLDVIAELHYEWQLNHPAEAGHRDQQIAGNVAVAYPWHRLFTPFVELNTVALVQGNDRSLRGHTQVYATPGFNVRPLPGMTIRAGVLLPVTETREFDWTVHAGIVWEF